MSAGSECRAEKSRIFPKAIKIRILKAIMLKFLKVLRNCLFGAGDGTKANGFRVLVSDFAYNIFG